MDQVLRDARPPTYAQFGQDRFVIDRLYPRMRGGTFLEIGAYDGETFSNTALLEREYGWRGICIEPLPGPFAALSQRRACICINAAASSKVGSMRFEALDGRGAMLSGCSATRPPAHDARIDREQQEHQFGRQTIDVDTVRAADVLRQHDMTVVDFASIDVEGGELDCLRGLIEPGIVVRALAIENNYGDRDVAALLAAAGFARIATLGDDDIYRLRSECGARERVLQVLNARRMWRRDRKRRQRARAS